MMPSNRSTLEAMLASLEARMPALLAEFPNIDDEFWTAFAGEAEAIEELAGPEDAEFVRGRIDCVLGAHGVIPPGPEGSRTAQ